MNLDDARNLAIIFGTIVATVTLVKGLFEYMRQNTQKRAEYYIQMREKFMTNEHFQKIFELLENDDPKLATLSYEKKLDFLGFYEDIALMVNSDLLKRPVAHYMFSYYAIKCWKSKYFWSDLQRNSVYWLFFRDFVNNMEKIEKSLIESPNSIKRYKI